jgi:hypothetical protein
MSLHCAPQAGQAYAPPAKQRKWNVWLHWDVTAVCPRITAPPQAAQYGGGGGGGAYVKHAGAGGGGRGGGW